MVPVYYAAYRVGAALLGSPPETSSFQLSWDWLRTAWGLWKPFLLGCLVCAVVTACSVAGAGARLALAGDDPLPQRPRAATASRPRAVTARSDASPFAQHSLLDLADPLHAAGEPQVVRHDDEAGTGSRLSSSISANTARHCVPSRLPVGSSASTIFGSVTSARATAAR